MTFALLSFNPDPVISGFMGIDLFTFSTELGGTLAQVGQRSRTRYYIAPGSSHVVLTTQTVGLSAWLQQMVDGAPNWQKRAPVTTIGRSL